LEAEPIAGALERECSCCGKPMRVAMLYLCGDCDVREVDYLDGQPSPQPVLSRCLDGDNGNSD
jgi:hypothetical protein